MVLDYYTLIITRENNLAMQIYRLSKTQEKSPNSAGRESRTPVWTLEVSHPTAERYPQ